MDNRKILKTLTEMKMAKTGGVLPVGGFSMIPLLSGGDYIKLKKQKQYKIGDIVVCVDGRARLLVHRIIRINKIQDKTVYITKGDNAVATETVSDEFCLGKVVEVENVNGKHITIDTPSPQDIEIVRLSRKVNDIYVKTKDPNVAFSSKYHMAIYDMAPDYLKDYVYNAQNYMIEKSVEFMTDMLSKSQSQQSQQSQQSPQSEPEKFEFTRDFYSMLVSHRVLNILTPYVYENSGRFGKFLKLTKARNIASASKRLKMAAKIAEEFEKAGIRYVLYKGLAVSQALYGDPNIRECDDVDFLISPEDIKKAHQIMYSLDFSHLDQKAKTLTFYRTEEPVEDHPTHLLPYAHPETGITAEIHTAVFILEKYTESLLAARQKINVKGHEIYVLSDIDAYVCQLFITAVDDYGCSNMSFDEDPNIFLRLKFRNYVDICMLTQKFAHITEKEVLAVAAKYDIHFYLYIALFYTCEIFGYNQLTVYAEKILHALKDNQKIGEALYNLPVEAKECLRSPFKMKMNGAALKTLRDAYYISGQRFLQNEPMLLSPGKYVSGGIDGVSEKISCCKNGITFNYEIDTNKRGDEYVLFIRGFCEEEVPKLDAPYYILKFVYHNVCRGIVRKGKILFTELLPPDELAQIIYNRVKRYTQKMSDKDGFGRFFEMNTLNTNISYSNIKTNSKSPVTVGVFYRHIIDFKEEKIHQNIDLSDKSHQIVKIIFD